MQIDVSKERENNIKDLYERNIATLKQDMEYYKQKLSKIENKN